MSARVVAFAALLAVAIAPARATADGPSRVERVAVRAPDDAGRALLSRIRGQTVDLGVEIVVLDAPAIEANRDAQKRSAPELAARSDAEVVVWLDISSADRIEVCIAEPSTNRLLVRSIPVQRPGAPTSGALESAALMVRATVRALAQGEPLEQVEPLAPRVVPPAPRPAAPPPRPRPRPRPAPPAQPSWSIDAGWHIVQDGVGGIGHHGPIARIAWSGIVPWLVVALEGSFGLASSIETEYASIGLTRHSLTGAVALRWGPTTTLHALFGLRAGVVAYSRETTEVAPMVEPTGRHWTLSPAFGPEVRVAWLPILSGRVGIASAVALDVVPSRPDLGVEADGAFQPVRTLWWGQARAAVALEVAF